MTVILKCVKSNNENFTEGRRYLFIDGTLTCDTRGFGSNIYLTDKVQQESHCPLLKNVEDVNDFFKNRKNQVHFIEDTTTTHNWFFNKIKIWLRTERGTVWKLH